MKLLEILGVIANLAGISEAELSDKLTANSEGENLDKTTVETALNEVFGAKLKSVSEQQYNRGLKEKGKSLESDLKKHFAFESNSIGVDLVKEIVAARESEVRSEKGDKDVLTAENVGENPIVKEFVKSKVQTAVQTATSELTNEVETLTTELKTQKQKENKSVILNSALELLEKNKAILGKDNKKDPKRIRTIEILLSQHNYKVEDGKPIPVDSEGNQLLHPTTYNPITFEEQIKELNPFGFHEIDPSNSSPSPKTKTPTGSGDSPKSEFKNREEFLAFQNDPNKSYEDKKKAAESWKASQATE